MLLYNIHYYRNENQILKYVLNTKLTFKNKVVTNEQIKNYLEKYIAQAKTAIASPNGYKADFTLASTIDCKKKFKF